MTTSQKSDKKPRSTQRVDREACALQKNPEKRKQQQKKREALKQEIKHGQN